jgi:hypothetical protein
MFQAFQVQAVSGYQAIIISPLSGRVSRCARVCNLLSLGLIQVGNMSLHHQGVWVVGIIAAHGHVDYNRSAFFFVRKLQKQAHL